MPKKPDLKDHMAKIRAMRGKGGKRKPSRAAVLRKELKETRKILSQQGKMLAKQHKMLEKLSGVKKKRKV